MEQPRNRRAIIGRQALAERITALGGAYAPGSAKARAALLAELKATLAAGRAEIASRFDAGEPGDQIARANCYLIDQIVEALYAYVTDSLHPVTNPTAGERMALVAVGGYGRGELAPFSDIDLLFLHPYKITPWGESVVESMLYVLWDLGLKVGHATRSVDDCIRLAKGDATIATALLEARYLWGDRALFDELEARFASQVAEGHEPEYVEQKLAERDQRHERYGNTRYVVEPNLKEGKGGLRDLHTLSWIAKYVYRVADMAELVERGVLRRDEYRRFAKASRFLWTVRCHLHDLTGRAEERLTFDVQPELARRLGYTDRASAKAIERFMKHYYLVAKDVGDLTRILCTAIEEEHRRRPRFRWPRLGQRRREIEGFVAEGGRLNVLSDDDFRHDPVKFIRLFHVAQRRELDIHPNALRLIRRDIKLVNRSLRQDDRANRLFLEILTGEKDPETALKRMNEAGVLGRFVTDFGRVVAQTQHDMYHHYTVDEHTIRAIGVLWRIEQGLLTEDHPLSTEIVQKVLSRRVLYLALFLHDIAKGRGGNHSELGADVARKLGPRLGLDEAETETVAWLVLHHLAMSATAFKRDISDPKTIQDFVALVQGPERLRLLLVLTVADIRAVGPGVWNGWKGQLLRELYFRAEEAMTAGLGDRRIGQLVPQAKEALAAALSDWSPEEIAAHSRRFFDSYWLGTDTETQVRHARLMRDADRAGRQLTIETRSDDFRSISEVTLYTGDHAGLFTRIAGAMAVTGANIVEARIATTTDGMALDTFFIQDAEGNAFDQPSRLAKLSATIENTLTGDKRPHRILAEETTPYPKRTAVFRVAPVVLIDNNASATWTVIEVNGRDRAGLLHDLTWALFSLSLTIGSARIATYGERAVDVFYVRDLFGLKITHAAKLAKIERVLREALTSPAERGDQAEPQKKKRAPRGRTGPAASTRVKAPAKSAPKSAAKAARRAGRRVAAEGD